MYRIARCALFRPPTQGTFIKLRQCSKARIKELVPQVLEARLLRQHLLEEVRGRSRVRDQVYATPPLAVASSLQSFWHVGTLLYELKTQEQGNKIREDV